MPPAPENFGVTTMSTDPYQKPTPRERIKTWFGNLIDDPISTLMDSAVWLFMLAIGLFLFAMFARMGWGMIRDAWKSSGL
jgi:hypothetical protein